MQSVAKAMSQEVKHPVVAITYKPVEVGSDAEARLNRAFDLLFDETLKMEHIKDD